MNRLLLVFCLASISVVALAATVPDASDGEQRKTIDRGLRYVNDNQITLRDLSERMKELRDLRAQMGLPPARSKADVQQLIEAALEQLTVEELLLDHFDFLRERQPLIEKMAEEKLERREMVLDVAEEMAQRRDFERKIKVELAFEFFSRKMPPVSPLDIREAYEQQRQAGGMTRPARVRLWRIVLRPLSDKELADLNERRRRLFVQAQGIEAPVIAAIVDPLVDRWLTADAVDRQAVLDDFMDRVGAVSDAEVADMPPEVQRLAERVRSLRDEAADAMGLDEAVAFAQGLKERVAGADVDAFADLARRFSQGPKAADGGDLGLIEEGAFQPEIEEVIFTEQGDLGVHGPLVYAGVVHLYFVSEREAVHHRGFDEASAELRSQLEQKREDEVHQRLVEQLRSRALIVDLVTSQDLLEAFGIEGDASEAEAGDQ